MHPCINTNVFINVRVHTKKGVCNIIAISIKIAIEFKLQKYEILKKKRTIPNYYYYCN